MGLDLETLLTSYQLHLRAGRRSQHTLTTYSESIQLFIDWLKAEGIEPVADNFTRDNLRTWLIFLQETFAPATALTRFSAVARFGKWLVDEEELDADPGKGIPKPRVEPQPIPVLTDDDLTALLADCRQDKTLYGRRDEAAIRVLLSTGVRVSELCDLNLDDVDLVDGTAIVEGKGRKVRQIVFSTRTIAALDRYIRARNRAPKADEPALFITQRGRMNPATVRAMLKERGTRIGVPGLHPHQFRHTFAHDFLMAGGQERDLKRLAGWSSNIMLERYGASAADARARHAAEKLNRGDRV